MSIKVLSCPTQKQLADFAAGKSNVTESAEIEQHLADCESCCQLLKMLPDEDTLVSLLRDAQAETANDNEPSRRSPRFAATLPSGNEQVTLPPAGDATEIADADSMAASLSLPEPLRAHSRYRVTELIGRGGMGDVYKAHHRMMNRPVALKVINGQLVNSPAAVQRFHREVQAAARLSHPNIVTAYDAEQAGDTHFLVMEYVDGVELADVIKERGPLPVGEACEYIRQAAIGLQHAHEQGMVHRDIKPQNFMVVSGERRAESQEPDATTSGSRPSTLNSRPTVKILDFGLANLAEAAVEEVIHAESGSPRDAVLDRQLTQIGSMMGTPDYMAPEQASDAHQADIRSDIYSLGCTLYCLLSGNAPFAEGSVVDKVRAHSQHAAQPLSELRDDVPAELEAVIARMMNKSPDERYGTPIEVAKALEPFVGPPSQRGHAVSKPTLRPHRSIVVPLAIVGTLLLGLFIALAGVIVVMTDQGRMVIQSEVGDVQVVVKQNGEEITTIDAKTGTQVKWLSTGEYEVELVGGDNDVKLDKTGFQMTRLGTVIVTARWNGEGSGVIRSFTTDDPTITRDGVEIDDGGWKITANDTQTVRLFEVPMPPMNAGPFFYRAKMKTENVKGRAYLEMWVRFPGHGEFFSKGFHIALSGSNGWAEYEIPFLLEKGQQPDLVKLNVTIEGGGTVWIKDVELRGRTPLTSDQQQNQGVWTQLFNGRDLTGWKTHPDQPDGWKVESGQLVGSSATRSHLFTARGDYEDFHLRAEVKINSGGNSGIFFRSPFELSRSYPVGYEAQICDGVEFAGELSGSLYRINPPPNRLNDRLQLVVSKLVATGEWFTLEVIAKSNHFVIKVNGETTVDYVDDEQSYASGHIALQVLSLYDVKPQPTVVQFRKIEIQELSGRSDNQNSEYQITPVRRMIGQRGSIHQLAFLPDSRRLISVSNVGAAGSIRVWDCETGIDTELASGRPAAGLAVSPDGNRVAVGRSGDGCFNLYDCKTGAFIATFPGPGEPVAARLSFSADGSRVLSAGADRIVRLWDIDGQRELRRFDTADLGLGVGEGIRTSYSADGRFVATLDADGKTHVWKAETGDTVHILDTHAAPPVRSAFTPEGDLLVLLISSGAESIFGNDLQVFQTSTGKELWRTTAHKSGSNSLAMSPRGDFIVTAGLRDKTLRVWDTATGRELLTSPAAEDVGTALAVSPDGRSIASSRQAEPGSAASSSIQLWRLPESLIQPIAGLTDYDRLQGSWVGVEAVMGNKPLSKEALTATTLTFDHDQVDVAGFGSQTFNLKYALRQFREPKWIEFINPDKTADELSIAGIYAFDGDMLRIAFDDADRPRPRDFTPTDQHDHFVGTFRRATASQPKQKPARSSTGILTNPPSVPPGGLPVGKNLIVDPSLENTPTGELPNGWFAWLDDGPDFKCEVVEGGVTGKHCLQISGTGTRGVVFVTSMPLDRTKRYALKGHVKVEGEAGTWAVIKLNYFNSSGWLGVDDRIGVTTSDLDWNLFEKTDAADQYPTATLIVPTCHIEGNGTAWFDDLEVIAYDREKLPDDFDATRGKNNRMK